MLKGPPPLPMVWTRTERRVPGVITKRTRGPISLDAMTFRGIPVTNVPRTLVDLAAVLDEADLARACHEAAVRYRTTPAHVERVLERRPTNPGATKLRRILHGHIPVTLSQLEAKFLERLREWGLPLPRTNIPAGGRYVDCRWDGYHLTVELDSYRFHATRHAWEQDRRRERDAHRRGDDFRRYTYGDVYEDPADMYAELTTLLPAAAPGPSRHPGPRARPTSAATRRRRRRDAAR
jgi:hypothetical protein